MFLSCYNSIISLSPEGMADLINNLENKTQTEKTGKLELFVNQFLQNSV
jgi:hypothetical protein